MSEASAVLPFAYVALVGSPNSGKTSLFNALTGSRQKVGNYPGVTVERKEGRIKIRGKEPIKILDLPGTYSLNAATLDEGVTRDVLLSGHFEKIPPSLLVAVADATNLERNLSLVLELKELGIPTLLALNMMDLAKRRGMEIDVNILAKELGMPVIPVVATKRRSTGPLRREIETHLGKLSDQPHFAEHVPLESRPPHQSSKEKLIQRYQEIDRVLAAAKIKELKPSLWTHRIDRLVLHPLWGTLLLYAILALIFQGIFNWASYPMNWIESGIGVLSKHLSVLLPDNWFRSLWVDGILAGVGAVVVFLPQILLLFFMILLLEDSGYMARAAFLMDRHMRRVGLHGRAFLPLLSSFACAIPGIMATRTIENKRDRMTTILIAPLMACSARIPVYTLLIAAFIPNRPVWGPFRLQGLVMLGLYLLGALVAFVMAWLIKKLLLKSPEPVFLMELPTYKWPSLSNVWHGMWERGKIFLRRAGTIILGASVIIWALSSYPKPEGPLPPGQTAITYSYAGRIGKAIEPVVAPLGYDWSIAVGLVTGVVAREVIVGTLATIYAVESEQEGGTVTMLSRIIQERWSLATGLSLLVFFVFAMQCLSTLVVARRETNSWRWPAFMFAYMTALAYGAAWLTYHAAQYFTG
jgi:ferrous iron transport protein B